MRCTPYPVREQGWDRLFFQALFYAPRTRPVNKIESGRLLSPRFILVPAPRIRPSNLFFATRSFETPFVCRRTVFSLHKSIPAAEPFPPCWDPSAADPFLAPVPRLKAKPNHSYFACLPINKPGKSLCAPSHPHLSLKSNKTVFYPRSPAPLIPVPRTKPGQTVFPSTLLCAPYPSRE